MSDVTRPAPPSGTGRSTGSPLPGALGQGTLGRATALVYWYVVVTALLALAALPTLALLLLLDRAASNVPLAALAALPLGPALSAALYAVRARETDDEVAPARTFVRGYRRGALDALRVWAPALGVLALVGVVLANASAAGVGPTYAAVLVVIAVLALVWGLHAVAIVTFFSFRTRDVARLAAHYLGRTPLVSLGVVSLLVAAAGVAWFATDGVLALVGGVWVWCWYRNDRRMLDDVRARFTTA
ncbi:glycosyltransferase [Cellulosimicrobium cellulans]|uniref:glycosyltransferase n=1 Tax=Cellulosimicrobium cellulans TaxID=1710 RepID=UPI0036F12BD0